MLETSSILGHNSVKLGGPSWAVQCELLLRNEQFIRRPFLGKDQPLTDNQQTTIRQLTENKQQL